jgi:hypothetical protein
MLFFGLIYLVDSDTHNFTIYETEIVIILRLIRKVSYNTRFAKNNCNGL